MRFAKYHALGNDYLVLDAAHHPAAPSPAEIRRICDRHFGLGSDGILHGPLPAAPGAEFGLRIFNPDGSEAEKSGNGLRIFARYLWDERKVRAGAAFTVHTPGGIATCIVREGGREITVEMGRVSFLSSDIPVKVHPAREMLDQEISLEGQTWRFYAATVGNPHCVVPLDSISPSLARRLGPLIETHPMFPNRTNVQLLKVRDRENIELEIWERGAGYTLASGSSASAAAAVARKMGACGPDITVHMPGGKLRIHVAGDYAITMTGPATRVGEMRLDAEALM